MRNAPDVLLFDLDGTLIDSSESAYDSLRYAMEKVGLRLSRDEIRHFLGSAITQVLPERYGCTRGTAERVLKEFTQHYRMGGFLRVDPVPGMAKLAARLKEKGFRLAVATCKPWEYCGPILERCGYAPYFEAVAGSYHNGVPEEKTAVIGEALRLLNAPAETALMIGDRAADVLGAREFGIPCIGVEFCGYADPGELIEAGAMTVVDSCDKLEAVLSGLCRSKAEPDGGI